MLKDHDSGKKKREFMEIIVALDRISSITYKMHKMRIENSGINEIFEEYERLKGILRAGNFSQFNTLENISGS